MCANACANTYIPAYHHLASLVVSRYDRSSRGDGGGGGMGVTFEAADAHYLLGGKGRSEKNCHCPLFLHFFSWMGGRRKSLLCVFVFLSRASASLPLFLSYHSRRLHNPHARPARKQDIFVLSRSCLISSFFTSCHTLSSSSHGHGIAILEL